MKASRAEGFDFGFCTIISKNYLAFARTLYQSLSKHHPGTPLFVLLADKLDHYSELFRGDFLLVQLEELAIPDLPRFCFQYTQIELNTAVKPYFLSHLFDSYKLSKLIYLDPDILILRELSELVEMLDNYSIILTPHLTDPLEDDGMKPDEITILQAGVYNLGFIGLANTDIVHRFLGWWKRRLYDRCQMAPEQGMHVDQRWCDFVPAFYDGVYILRDPGYNVAYWNLQSRRVEIENGAVFVNGRPCYFFHFSGYTPDSANQLSKHQNRFTARNIGQVKVLLRQYRRLLLANGYNEAKQLPYAFDYFDNGARIPWPARKLYLNMGSAVHKFGNPFNTGSPNSFFSYLNECLDSKGSVTRLWYQVYQLRPDLQRAYPDVFGKDSEAFASWILNSGRFEYGIDGCLLPSSLLLIDSQVCKKKPPVVRRAVGMLDAGKAGLLNAGRRVLSLTVKPLLIKLPRTKLVRTLYARLIRPIEPTIRHLLEARLRRNNAVWELVRLFHYQLSSNFAVPQPAVPQRQYTGDRGSFGVNIFGYIQSEKGVGEAARSTIRSLAAANIPYVLNSVIDTYSTNVEKEYANSCGGSPYWINLVYVNADQVPYFFQSGAGMHLEHHYNIGCWNWELTWFPEEWYPSFEYFDEIWVPSSFVQEAVSRVTPIPVIRIPYSIRDDEVSTTVFARSALGLPEVEFIFLFVFDFASYAARKNPCGLIRAFQQAFTNDDKATLIIKCSHPEFSPGEFYEMQRMADRGKITIIPRVMTRDEVSLLFNACDCYVSLHRSEGYGLTIAEAMAMAKPVIATGYSGNMDFMNVGNSFPVKYSLVAIERDHGPYRKGAVWAEPDIEHAAELMRFVYRNREVAKQMGLRAQEDVRKILSPKAVGTLITQRFSRIMALRGAVAGR